MVAQPPEQLPLRRATSLFASYLTFGLYWGVWVVVFADFLADRRLTEGQAGLQLAALSVASIVTMTLVSPRLQLLPLTATIPLGLVAMGLGAALMATLPRELLTLGSVVVGVGNGLLDVFVDVGGQMAETRHQRPVLQFLHASYNVGGIVGALRAGARRPRAVPHGPAPRCRDLRRGGDLVRDLVLAAIPALARGDEHPRIRRRPAAPRPDSAPRCSCSSRSRSVCSSEASSDRGASLRRG